MNDNLYLRVHRQFAIHGGNVCMTLPNGEDWTYERLAERTARASGALLGLGVEPGDRVLVQVPKSPEAVALYLACLKVGAVHVPINPAYTESEVDYFLGDATPRLFVCGRTLDIEGVTSMTLDADGKGSFRDHADAAKESHHIVGRTSDDLAAIMYTSGTTGRSKGAMLTHGNLTSNTEVLCDFWGWRSHDVLLHALPIFHVHGLFVAIHCVLFTGTSMVFLPGFDADAVVEQLPKSTVLMGVPTYYTRILAHTGLTKDVCSSMRLFISGSAPLSEQTFRAFEERTGHAILERYGMSETMMNTSNPLVGERVAGTVGFALPGIDVRIAADDGAVLASGEVGGIEIRGPNVFSGYWRMPEKTKEEFTHAGFFRSGDLGVMDEDGRVTIVGREKDLVISGGYNVYPKEVEKLIDEMPEVVESSVIGVPHADLGEGVVAVVVPKAENVTATMVDAALNGRLARFKQPKRVVCVDALPRNPMGKVQKHQLRETYSTLLADE